MTIPMEPLMIILLWLAAVAPDPTQSIADSAARRTAQSCETSLSHKAGGEISSIDVTGFHRSGRTTILQGTMRVLQKPPTRPGEMTATHVIVARYSYECRSDGRRAQRIKLHAIDD
jgi:hypothetical protein